MYALAAADIMGVRSMHLEDAAEGEAEKPHENKTDEGDWIEKNEGWI